VLRSTLLDRLASNRLELHTYAHQTADSMTDADDELSISSSNLVQIGPSRSEEFILEVVPLEKWAIKFAKS